ncbi:MAG: tetratricopeptide repeat protein [Acidimicrobiales bacterium]
MTALACSVTDGCTGHVAADGYCDTCGAKARVGAGPAAGDHVHVAAVVAGGSCSQAGCGGTVAADGYCDTCGLSGAKSGASPVAASNAVSAPSIAAPVAPGTSAKISTGSSTRRTASTRRTGLARERLGVGLVQVPPTPVGDPAEAVMSAEKVQSVLGVVPEDDRVCTTCGNEVGRSSTERPGRVQGFCGNCRTPFDFTTNAPALSNSEMVAGQYEILGPMAHGGMGWIYLGRDKAVSDRWVVLKGLLNSDDADAAAAAVAERQFLARIEHGSIVNIYNFVTHAGAGYIVMEYVGGESLNSKLKVRRKANAGVPNPLQVQDAIAYIIGILPAFQYLHDLGLVYNDLKPANIMSVGDGVKLIDLGAVMQIDDPDAAIFGTRGFQAPEIASAGPSVASDLFTVGRTLAVMILDFVFHQGAYEYSLPTPTDEPLFATWESLYRFLLKATASHPDDRFQSADEMVGQLTSVLREIVAVTERKPRPVPSTHFEGDRLSQLLVDSDDTVVADSADWRVLPHPKVDPADPAAAFLIDIEDVEPARSLELIRDGLTAGTLPDSREVSFRVVRALIDAGGAATQQAMGSLEKVEAEDPWDWRVRWYKGLLALDADNPAAAAELFSQVWTEIPGEVAPKVAVALAAERAGEYERAANLYQLAAAVDSTFVSASFGLARCRVAVGDRAGAVEAYQQIPSSSAAYSGAQVQSVRTLAGSRAVSAPSPAELEEAAATIERLQIDGAERASLAAEVLERALAATGTGELVADGSSTLFGRPLTENELRRQLEAVYREQGRLADSDAQRYELIDKANMVRPRSLV